MELLKKLNQLNIWQIYSKDNNWKCCSLQTRLEIATKYDAENAANHNARGGVRRSGVYNTCEAQCAKVVMRLVPHLMDVKN